MKLARLSICMTSLKLYAISHKLCLKQIGKLPGIYFIKYMILGADTCADVIVTSPSE